MKIDTGTIRRTDGIIPPRPTTLQHPDFCGAASSTDEAIAEMLEKGKAIVLGGISILGERLYVVAVVSLLQMKNRVLRGWSLAIGHPEKRDDELERIDTSVSFPAEYPFPNTMIYFVGEAEESVVSADASPQELLKIVSFVFPFISDEGPPSGIDW